MKKYIFCAALFFLSVQTIALAAPLELKNGKSVDILAVGPMIFTTGLPTAWNMQYETSLYLNNTEALLLEANEIWNKVPPKEGYKTVIFQAMSKPEGRFIQHRKSFGFVFENKNGIWHMLEQEKPKKLTKEIIEKFLDRFEYLYINNFINGYLLYFDDNWTATINKKDKTKITLKRLEFAAIANSFFQQAKNPIFKSKILDIKISKDGQSAIVESEEIMNTEINGKQIKVFNHAYNHIALKGGYLLITKIEETEK
jgi:hypothetical protein